MSKKTLHERLIIKSLELGEKALREPRTAQDYKIRITWDRINNILNKRYERKIK